MSKKFQNLFSRYVSRPGRDSLISAVALLALTGCGGSNKNFAPAADNGPDGHHLTVQGSDTMSKLVQAWAADFMKLHSEAKVDVQAGDTGSGIEALIARKINVAAASHELSDLENMQAHDKGVRLMRVMVARDAVAVILSPQNKTTTITLDDLKDIFAGKITKWSQVKGSDPSLAGSPIDALGREISSGTGQFMREHVMHGEEYGPEVKLIASASEVVSLIQKNKGAIGFVGIAQAEDAGKQVRIVPIRLNSAANDDAVEDTINGSDYPLARPLYMYLDVNGSELTKSFVEYCRSDEGQKSTKKLGFLPLH